MYLTESEGRILTTWENVEVDRVKEVLTNDFAGVGPRIVDTQGKMRHTSGKRMYSTWKILRATAADSMTKSEKIQIWNMSC